MTSVAEARRFLDSVQHQITTERI